MARAILHVDMDEFFAAVEKLDRPELRGKCLLVGGAAEGRGVVSTASYEARKFGCHSAMPMALAVRLCPQAIVLPVRFERYAAISDRIFEILGRYTPLVEPLSCDEAFLDVTGSRRLFGPAEGIAHSIQDTIGREVGLTASLGVASNKFLAKLASDLHKPDGFTVIDEANVHEVLDGLKVEKLWGVGPATAERLHRGGVRTIGQLRQWSADRCRRLLGEWGEQLHHLANGEDDRPVTPDHQAKSIGQEQTFAQDLAEPAELSAVLAGQADEVARRLRRHGLTARTVTVKIRTGDFTTVSRSTTLCEATNLTTEIRRAAAGLFDAWVRTSFRPMRLIGVTASQLAPTAGGQLKLFEDPAREKQKKLDEILDAAAEKFGSDVLRRGDTE